MINIYLKLAVIIVIISVVVVIALAIKSPWAIGIAAIIASVALSNLSE